MWKGIKMNRQPNYAFSLEFEVSGAKALFTDPLFRAGGEKCSYQVPTYGALKGIAGQIYKKPTFVWYIDSVRIMNQIRTESRGARLLRYHSSSPDLADYMYLVDVRYQVKAHAEWNPNTPQYEKDRLQKKHKAILERALKAGGRLPASLGTSECAARIVACRYGEGAGYYDGTGSRDLGFMEHCILHASEGYNDETRSNVTAHFWNALMNNGEIVFPRPDECTAVRVLHRESFDGGSAV